VLFLDELNEFPRNVLEALRQPLEDGRVAVIAGSARPVLPGAVHARRLDEPLPLRVPWRPPLPLHRS
jgi:magnesium chelatase family protein